MISSVATGAICDAVQGHEEEILDRLPIPWRDGRPHIRCPYPNHDDTDPSWRWDNSKRRAFCTCLPKSQSILDVVMNVKNITFAEARIQVAEILGLTALIRTKKTKLDQERTSAAVLLNPQAANRDDRLVTSYLAHRLQVASDAVPLPQTRVIGVKELGYCDPPPQGSKAKPKLVSTHPCAVFETVGQDDRRHAHRIYLAPGGAGKADLGIGPTGSARDAKKSAAKPPGPSIAGLSVLWGDPRHAPWIILAEGIETAAAAAFAFASELSAGELAVAAAITAGGVTAFEPYPATKRVTVAADRDEAEKSNGGAASRRGEQAARAFALRNRETCQVSIALPGLIGETVDWLDIHLRNGREDVRAGILSGVPFEPTQVERDLILEQRTRNDTLAATALAYPPPAIESLHLFYEIAVDGKIKFYRYGRPDNQEDQGVPIPVATPFSVVARLRQADKGDAYGLRIMVQGMDGKPRPVDVERSELARSGAQEVRAALLAAGLRTEENGDAVVIAVLKAADPDHEIILVDRPGWHRVDHLASPVFVGPAGVILGTTTDCQLELTQALRTSPSTSGTMAGWQNAVRAACETDNCPHWLLGILAGFAGPIVGLTGLDSCGINLSGQSSGGKTLAQKLAVSAWTSPQLGAGLLQTMRTTENALEGLAKASNGTVLALDEMAHADGKAVGRMIYSIASGVGKARATRDAKLSDRHTWSTFAVLSGETSLESKVAADGGTWLAGMAVRFPDIDVSGINRSVPAETLRAINTIHSNFGHAGTAFVAGLIAEDYHSVPDTLRESILRAACKIAGSLSDSAFQRAAIPLAVLQVAGTLAKHFEILPASVPVASAVAWAWEQFTLSLDATVLSPAERALGNLRRFIAQGWDVTIKDIRSNAAEPGSVFATDREKAWRQNNREALGWYDDNTVYLPVAEARKAAGPEVTGQFLSQTLASANALTRRHDDRRVAIRYVPSIGKVDAYALRRSEFGRPRETASPVLVQAGQDQSDG